MLQVWTRSKGRQLPGTVLHSSDELGELSQCFKHDDSTSKDYCGIVVIIITGWSKNLTVFERVVS